ncbi:hypothetical protein HRbin02_00884 [Candidatus Calditenuaceae archaeon HR02]|nr:hypothetical protein HRbin02_00884 [Candidatus Calditenuaceae archaeon HR02]
MLGPEALPPIILTAILWLFILNLFHGGVEIEPVAPVVVVEEPVEAPASSPAPYLNTLTLLSVIAISGFTLFIIFKKFPKLISLISIGAFWIVAFLTLLVHLGYIGRLSVILPESVIVVVALLVSTFLAFLVRRVSGPAALTAASVTAAAGGTIIGYMIPLFTFIALTASLAVFDIVMVKKGYLSLLSQEQYRDRIHLLRGLVVEVGNVNLGLGDLLFYTITVTAAFFRLGLIPAIASNLAIMIGYYLTLQLLKKWDTVPGLTIPLVLALASAFAVHYL